MNTKIVSAALVAAMSGVLSAAAAEITVEPGGSIQKAINAAKAGDTVVIKGGVYHESFRVQKAYEGAPLIVRAAKGERVVLSGFEAITNWVDLGGGLYSAKVKGRVNDFFVGLKPLQCGRWPADGTLRPITSVDTDRHAFGTDPVKDAPFLAEIEKDPHDAVCFYYFRFGNSFCSPLVDGYDFKSGEIRFADKQWNRWLKPEGNRYSFMNHPALVREPGNWAFVSDAKDDKKNRAGTVYFRPRNPDDLKNACYRAATGPIVFVGHFKDKVSNVVIDGLEVMGGDSDGIKVAADDVTVQNCLVHHNNGIGIACRGVKNLKVLSNLVLANGNGVNLASVTGALVEGNEIAYGLVDGLTVAGNISGRPGGNPETTGVVVRNNYLHHHILQAHPDNFQMYRGVHGTVIERNFDIWGGQSIMTEEVDDVKFTDNVFMGCNAVMVICGHGNSNQWQIERNTLWGAGHGFFSFTGKDYTVKRNLIIGGSMPYGEREHDVKSSENFFSPSYTGRTAKPWKAYTSLEKAFAETGQEKDSRAGEVKMANFPAALGVAYANGNERGSVLMRKGAAQEDFAVGDKVELNGDGKLRTVTGWDAKTLVFSFEPALPAVPFRGVLIFNWKDGKSTVVDNTLAKDAPVFENGRQVYGATLSTVDFSRGDLLGKGVRTLPALPDEVAAAMPDPNDVIVPPSGH